MKKKFVLLFVFVFTVQVIMAQGSGTLQVSTTTKGTGGNYAPKNIVAVWVENENGQFVKTLTAYANSRKTYLDTWKTSTTNAGSANNTFDAVTGATRSSHGTINCSWNGADYKGNEVADGTYNLRFELTDKHSTGNLASFSFSKGSVKQEQTPADVPSFKSTSIQWLPTIKTGINVAVQQKEFGISFNPSTGYLTTSGENVIKIEVYNLVGQMVLKTESPAINLSNLSKGIYLIMVKADNQVYSRKILKNE